MKWESGWDTFFMDWTYSRWAMNSNEVVWLNAHGRLLLSSLWAKYSIKGYVAESYTHFTFLVDNIIFLSWLTINMTIIQDWRFKALLMVPKLCNVHHSTPDSMKVLDRTHNKLTISLILQHLISNAAENVMFFLRKGYRVTQINSCPLKSAKNPICLMQEHFIFLS